MTLQSQATIELADIRAIEFECAVCHAKMVFPVESFTVPPTKCCSCKSEQWMAHGDGEWEDLMRLGEIILWYGKSGNSSFRVRLEIPSHQAGG